MKTNLISSTSGKFVLVIIFMSHINVLASELLNDVSPIDDGYGAFTYSIPEGYQYADRYSAREYTRYDISSVRTVYLYNTNAIKTELNYFDGRLHTNYYSNTDNYFSIIPIGGLTNGSLTIDGEVWSGVNTPDGIEEIIDEIFQQRLNEYPITRIINTEYYGSYINTYGLTYNPTNQIFESNLFGYNGIIFKEFTFDWEPLSSQVYEVDYLFSTNFTADPSYDWEVGFNEDDPTEWFNPSAAWLQPFTNSLGEVLQPSVLGSEWQEEYEWLEGFSSYPLPEYGWYNKELNASGERPSITLSVNTNYIYSVTANQDVIIPIFGDNGLPDSYLNGFVRPVNIESFFPSAILNEPAQITKLYALDRDTLIEITFFDSAVILNNGIENIFGQFNTSRPNILAANLPEPIVEGQDTDGDGLLDFYEINFSLTEPADMDSDDDGLADGYEVNTSKTNPNKMDSDDDGLSDGEELFLHTTNPHLADTDNDGLLDGYEINVFMTSATNADSSYFTQIVTNTITNSVGLTLSEIADMRLGSQMISVSNSQALLRFGLDMSDDLTATWQTNAYEIEVEIPATNDVQFFRLRMD